MGAVMDDWHSHHCLGAVVARLVQPAGRIAAMSARTQAAPAAAGGRLTSIGRQLVELVTFAKDLVAVHWADANTKYWNLTILLGAAVMIGALWVAAAMLAEDERMEAERSAIRQNDNLALALEEQTYRTLKSVEQIIGQV